MTNGPAGRAGKAGLGGTGARGYHPAAMSKTTQHAASSKGAAQAHTDASDILTRFNWKPQPAAQKLVNELVKEFLKRCPPAAHLAQRMKDQTGTRFADWIDYIQTPRDSAIKKRLEETGFSLHPQPQAELCYVHDGAMFPSIVLGDGSTLRIGIKVESVMDFLTAQHIGSAEVHGEPLGQFRMALALRGKDADLLAVERHGYRGFVAPKFDAIKAVKAQQHLEKFCLRNRNFGSDAAGFAECSRLVDGAIADIGRDWACDLFFAAERRYWMQRNRAAQVQYARQQRLGLGWANHDHHTYRSSREHFTRLVAIWEKLGFHCRERFYAGHEAQWGAQVMEQPITGITTFNDVDMNEAELLGDFSHEGFTEKRAKLGTVGLWCALHGEAILQAGMHHLEAMFDYHALVEQLESANIRTMHPFTTFPYLRQAFTEGEPWDVSEDRLDVLLEKGFITHDQAETFMRDGAIGSHLENLERNDGFKGFNQQGVSDIIARTDPRKHKVARSHAHTHGVGA